MRWSTAAASAAIAVVLLDVTAVGVLLPTVRADLGSSPSGGQWVMNAYLLALAVVLPLAASVRISNRLLTAAGAAAMAAGAVVSATAGSTATLVIGRVFAGAGVALLLTAVTADLPAARRTTGAVAAFPLAALAFGPLVGGELAEHNWWHLYFWAGVPAAAILAVAALLDGDRQRPAPPPLSAGRLALIAGLVVVTILLVQSEPWGVGTKAVVTVIGIAGSGLFVARAVAPESTAWAAAAGPLAALCFLMPQYFELAHLIHPLRSGVRLSALTIAAVAGGALGWRLRSMLPPRLLAAAGIAIAGVGLIGLSAIDPTSGTAALGAGLVVAGGGLGICAGATSDGRLGDQLVAAATGAAYTLAVSGAVFQHVQADERSGGASFEAALSQGVGEAAAVLFVLALVIFVALWRVTPASSAARPAAES